MDARHVNIENGGRTTHFGALFSALAVAFECCGVLLTFDDTKPPPEAVNGHIVLVQIFTRFGALANVT